MSESAKQTHCYPTVRNSVTQFVLGLDSGDVGSLPSMSGVYFLVSDRQEVEYVGCAVDIQRRWSGHALRAMAISNGWKVFYKEVDARHFRSKEHEEAFFIATLRPRCNNSLKCKVHG